MFMLRKNHLSKISILGITLVASIFLANCSEKSFTAADNSLRPQCKDDDTGGCVITCEDSNTCTKFYDYQIDATASIADILFVVDNSGSMSAEQEEMGSRFQSFLSSVSDLDYRIAITTTDISDDNNPADANNGWGAFQNGKLINFSNGQAFLDGSANNEQSLFQENIQRNETIVCDNSDYHPDSCASGDERGILAAYLTLSNNYNNFVRDTGHMALVFLSDEDERSQGGGLDDLEFPSIFAEEVKKLYPNKSFAAHSIVIQPPDSPNYVANCLSQQIPPNAPRGFYGTRYAELTAIMGGVYGNICADNYSQQLQDIGDDVAQPREILPCQPIEDEIQVSFIPEPSYDVQVTQNLENREILFSDSLPKGTKIRFQFTCKN